MAARPPLADRARRLTPTGGPCRVATMLSARIIARSRAIGRAIALAGGIGGASLGFAGSPLSPYANPIDLTGRYMCPSPGVMYDGFALASTGGCVVYELSNDVEPQEN